MKKIFCLVLATFVLASVSPANAGGVAKHHHLKKTGHHHKTHHAKLHHKLA